MPIDDPEVLFDPIKNIVNFVNVALKNLIVEWCTISEKSCSSNAAASNLGMMNQKFDAGHSRSPNFPCNISLSSQNTITPISFANSLDLQTEGSGVDSNYCCCCLKAQDKARIQS